MSIEKGDALNFKEEISMKFTEKFEVVLKMVMEATVLHDKSLNAMCIEDEYERYILTANWYDGAPTLYITYDNVHGDGCIYYEVGEINRQEIVRLLEVWQEIEESFGEED